MVTVLDEAKWLTPARAAHILGVTPLRVRQLMQQGKLDHMLTPLGRLVDAQSVEAQREARLTVAV